MSLKIAPLRTTQITSININSRIISFRNVIWLLVMYLLGIPDPSIKCLRITEWLKVEATTFATA
jgi:hypothetical protein